MAYYVTKDSGERVNFVTGAQRDTAAGKGRFDLIPVLAMRRVAQLYERGAMKYDARNWEKGIPVSRMFDSAKRHVDQAISGDQTEDHLAGAIFNLIDIMEYEERADLGMPGYAELFADLGELYYFNNPRRRPMSPAVQGGDNPASMPCAELHEQPRVPVVERGDRTDDVPF